MPYSSMGHLSLYLGNRGRKLLKTGPSKAAGSLDAEA